MFMSKRKKASIRSLMYARSEKAKIRSMKSSSGSVGESGEDDSERGFEGNRSGENSGVFGKLSGESGEMCSRHGGYGRKRTVSLVDRRKVKEPDATTRKRRKSEGHSTATDQGFRFENDRLASRGDSIDSVMEWQLVSGGNEKGQGSPKDMDRGSGSTMVDGGRWKAGDSADGRREGGDSGDGRREGRDSEDDRWEDGDNSDGRREGRDSADGRWEDGNSADGRREGRDIADGRWEDGDSADGRREGRDIADGRWEDGDSADGRWEDGDSADGRWEDGNSADGRREGRDSADGRWKGGDSADGRWARGGRSVFGGSLPEGLRRESRSGASFDLSATSSRDDLGSGGGLARRMSGMLVSNQFESCVALRGAESDMVDIGEELSVGGKGLGGGSREGSVELSRVAKGRMNRGQHSGSMGRGSVEGRGRSRGKTDEGHEKWTNLAEESMQRDAELLFYSQEIFRLNNLVSSLENEKIKFQGKIERTRSSRDKWKKEVVFLKRVLQRRSRPVFVTYCRPPTDFGASKDKYSDLKNSTSKKKKLMKALSSLQAVAMEDDVHPLLKDLMKLLEGVPSQSFHFKLSLWQSVILASRLRLSCGQLEQMKQLLVLFTGIDYFPPVKKIRELGKVSSKIDLFEESSHTACDGSIVSVVQCTNLVALIVWKLECFGDLLVFDEYTGNDIVLAVGADSGGQTTKVCILFGNLRNPNSVDNVLTIAVYDDGDDYNSFTRYLTPLIRQINALSTVTYTINNIKHTKKIHLKVVGDFKFVGESLGHMKQTATFFCLYCFEENGHGARKTTLKDLDQCGHSIARTIDLYVKHSKTGGLGVYKCAGPLFPKVLLLDHLVGMLHCVTGIFLKYIFWPLWEETVRLDNTTNFEIHTDKRTTLKLANNIVNSAQKKYEECRDWQEKRRLRAVLSSLKKERKLLDVVVNGIPMGKLKELEAAFESVGASRRAFYQVFSGNHTRKVLTPEGIRATFEVFGEPRSQKLHAIQAAMEQLSGIMTLSANKMLDADDIRELQEKTFYLGVFLRDGFPHFTITEKLHVMLFHVVQLAAYQGSLGRLSEQGIEATHARFNMHERRFSSFRDKKKRYLHCTQELLVASIANSMLQNPPAKEPPSASSGSTSK